MTDLISQSIAALQFKLYRFYDKGTFSIDNRKRGSSALGFYPTQDTSRMGTARAKQEEEADTRIKADEE